jgi:hypothetical protein
MIEIKIKNSERQITDYKKDKDKVVKDILKEKINMEFISKNSLVVHLFRKALGK